MILRAILSFVIACLLASGLLLAVLVSSDGEDPKDACLPLEQLDAGSSISGTELIWGCEIYWPVVAVYVGLPTLVGGLILWVAVEVALIAVRRVRRGEKEGDLARRR